MLRENNRTKHTKTFSKQFQFNLCFIYFMESCEKRARYTIFRILVFHSSKTILSWAFFMLLCLARNAFSCALLLTHKIKCLFSFSNLLCFMLLHSIFSHSLSRFYHPHFCIFSGSTKYQHMMEILLELQWKYLLMFLCY